MAQVEVELEQQVKAELKELSEWAKQVEEEKKDFVAEQIEIKQEIEAYFQEISYWLQTQQRLLLSQLDSKANRRQDSLERQHQQITKCYNQWKDVSEQTSKLEKPKAQQFVSKLIEETHQLKQTYVKLPAPARQNQLKLVRTEQLNHLIMEKLPLGNITLAGDINLKQSSIDEFKSFGVYDEPASFTLTMKNDEGKIIVSQEKVVIACEIKLKGEEKSIEAKLDVLDRNDGSYVVTYVIPGSKDGKQQVYEMSLIVDGQIWPEFPRSINITPKVKFVEPGTFIGSFKIAGPIELSNNEMIATKKDGIPALSYVLLNQIVASPWGLEYKIRIDRTVESGIYFMLCEGEAAPRGDFLKDYYGFSVYQKYPGKFRGPSGFEGGVCGAGVGDIVKLQIDLNQNVFTIDNLTRKKKDSITLPAGKTWKAYCLLRDHEDQISLL